MLSLVLLAFIVSVSSASSTPLVTTPLGKIEGYTKTTVYGKNFYAFEGVPYAQPPVGQYRFKNPVPIKPWSGTWEANTMFKCMQYDHFTPRGQDYVSGDEDCLYVNIYTPIVKPTKKLNVLFYIHGGAFMFGSGGVYGPEILMERDVIYVNINYRLGPLGFLSTEDNVVPGNNGLRDQIMALKFIKDNIEYFGGNPDSITIYGMSAGGASTEFHYLFPQSRGLFKQGFSQSGCVLNPWVLMEHPMEKTKEVAKLVGCPTEGSEEIVKCLKNKPARQIVHTVKQFQPWLYNPFSPFGAVVDTWAKDPLLSEHPYKLLENKKVFDVPWLASYVSGEGLYPGSDFYYDEHLEYLDENWNKIMPYILHYNDAVPKDQLDSVSEKIRKEYLKSHRLTKDTFGLLIQAMSDRLFVVDIEKAGRLHSAAVKSPVYSYYFDYRGVHSKTEFRANTEDHIGVSHADDTAYALKAQYLDSVSTEQDREMSKVMVDMLVSYMETSKPNTTANWKPLPKKESEPWVQVHISNAKEIFIEEVKTELGNNKFWDSLPFHENEKLFQSHDEL